MKKFFSSVAGRICLAVLGLAVLGTLGAIGIWQVWLYQQPKFRNVTIELGDRLPAMDAFLTEHADPAKAQMITLEHDVDLTKAGQQSIIFCHGAQEETVTLIIQDTTPPAVEFQPVITSIDKQPAPEDFVASVSDKSATTVSFVQPLQVPETYGEMQVEVVVTDAEGNSTAGQCSLRYTWMYDTVTLELGQLLEKQHLLLKPDKDSELIDQAQLDTINASPVGTYTVSSSSMGQDCTCTVTVQDTTPPTLELREVHIDIGDGVSVKSFIKTAEDASGEVTTRLMTDLELGKQGTQTVLVEAEDINGNISSGQTVLKVYLDSKPPVFSGVKELTVEKNSSPDFSDGVTATDARDGTVSFSVDSSGVDLSKAGTYYVSYVAQDAVGNKASARRKVTVKHNQEDTQALVNSIAATLSNDAEQIRDYVRRTISYSSHWGGDDPVWHGFTTKSGNCYVHALCLQRLLQSKGYTTQLIWVTDRSHYWLIINLNGVWRHIDATPGNQHSKYSLMTDSQRSSTLSGRDWDRTQWPVCE